MGRKWTVDNFLKCLIVSVAHHLVHFEFPDELIVLFKKLCVAVLAVQVDFAVGILVIYVCHMTRKIKSHCVAVFYFKNGLCILKILVSLQVFWSLCEEVFSRYRPGILLNPELGNFFKQKNRWGGPADACLASRNISEIIA